MFYNEFVTQIGIRELNQHTSQVLDRVKAGEEIEITDRGVPIAELRPIRGARAAVARLAAEGRLAPATVDPGVLTSLPTLPTDDIDVADRLAADREDERW
jgi:prevent-host-death family protein